MNELNGSEILSNLMDELERFADMAENMEEADEMLKAELRDDISADLDRYSEISDDMLKAVADMEISLSINDGHSIEKNTGHLFLNLVENNALAVCDVLSPAEQNTDMDRLLTDISDCIRTYPEYRDSLDTVLKEISPEQQKENDIHER